MEQPRSLARVQGVRFRFQRVHGNFGYGQGYGVLASRYAYDAGAAGVGCAAQVP